MADTTRSFLKEMAAGILGSGMRIGVGMSTVSAWTGAQTNSILNQARPADQSMLKVVKVEPFILRVRRDAKGNLSGTSYYDVPGGD
jgi:hypothetical protein